MTDICRNCTGGGSATTSPEAQDGSQNINYIRAYQAAYTAPLSDRLLVEAGVGAVVPDYGNPKDGFDRSIVRAVNQVGNFPNMIAPIPNIAYRSMFSGSGALVRAALPRVGRLRDRSTETLKVGIETYNNISTRNYQRGDSLQYRLSNGVPNQITELLSDFTEEARVQNIGIFAQDRWTFRRFTLQGASAMRTRRATRRTAESGRHALCQHPSCSPSRTSSRATTTSPIAVEWRWMCSATGRRR